MPRENCCHLGYHYCIFVSFSYQAFLFTNTLKISVLTDNSTWLETFFLGWLVTIVSGISAYPLDTIKRRMMMTAGQSVKYSSSWACLKEVVRMEGAKALFRGAGVNIVRGVAGAGVLSGFERLKKVYIIKRESI